MLQFLNSLLSLWSVALLLFCFATLAWFFYWIFLRKIMRVRRIANVRMARLLREGAGGEHDQETR